MFSVNVSTAGSLQALNEEIISRKKTVDQAIKNGQALLKQTTGTFPSSRLCLLVYHQIPLLFMTIFDLCDR